mmetsp:Transcript_98546/g.181166  ORF Transcript_98546/g.181166 Transcript_98546/m.181166 type:complete len:303 (+) Transcript_98546:479-1387(+)
MPSAHLSGAVHRAVLSCSRHGSKLLMCWMEAMVLVRKARPLTMSFRWPRRSYHQCLHGGGRRWRQAAALPERPSAKPERCSPKSECSIGRQQHRLLLQLPLLRAPLRRRRLQPRPQRPPPPLKKQQLPRERRRQQRLLLLPALPKRPRQRPLQPLPQLLRRLRRWMQTRSKMRRRSCLRLARKMATHHRLVPRSQPPKLPPRHRSHHRPHQPPQQLQLRSHRHRRWLHRALARRRPVDLLLAVQRLTTSQGNWQSLRRPWRTKRRQPLRVNHRQLMMRCRSSSQPMRCRSWWRCLRSRKTQW